MLKGVLVTLGMIAVGIIVWRALNRQGYGSPPDDTDRDRADR